MDYTITSKQLTFILVGCMLGTGVITLPRVTTEVIEQDAWLAVFFGAIIPFLSLWLTSRIIGKYPGLSFIALTEKLAGKIFGRLLAAVFAIYSILAAAVILRIFLEIITMYLLPKTPMLVKVMLGLGVSAYMASSGIKVLGRLNEFLFYVLLPLVLFVLPALFIYGDIHYLMPVLNHSINEYSKAAITTGYAYSGFETLIVFGPYVIKKKETFKASIIALSITVSLYLFAVITTMVVFGAGLTQKITWPVLRILSVVDIPVFERIEFLFILAWIGSSIKPVCNQYFCACLIIKDMFGIKSLGAVVAILFPIIAFIAWYPKNIYATFRFSDFVGTYSLILGTAMPMFLLGLSLIRSKGRVKDEGNS